MIDEDTEMARQQVVEDIVRRLHAATGEDEDYRTVFADLTRQLVDRMEGCGHAWRTPTRHPQTAELMRDIVDPAVAAHSTDDAERRMAYAETFRKVSESVLCGVQHAKMRADLEGATGG